MDTSARNTAVFRHTAYFQKHTAVRDVQNIAVVVFPTNFQNISGYTDDTKWISAVTRKNCVGALLH